MHAAFLPIFLPVNISKLSLNLPCLQVRDRMYLVMEYCSGGDLSKYIRRHKRIPEASARALLRQLAAGLRELWSRNLVHVCSCCPLKAHLCSPMLHA